MIADDVGENWLIVVTGFGKTKPNWVRWSFFCVPFCIKSMEFRCSSNSLSLCTLHTRHSKVGKINRFLKRIDIFKHFTSFAMFQIVPKKFAHSFLSLDHFRLVSEKMTGFTQCAMVIGNILDIFLSLLQSRSISSLCQNFWNQSDRFHWIEKEEKIGKWVVIFYFYHHRSWFIEFKTRSRLLRSSLLSWLMSR